jgi:hypothetical protein
VSGKPIDHNRAIALAARAALAPLGFRRKGQSRTWLADHGYWLLAIEFQPSAWSKGSYLNVAAHWLWAPPSLSEPRYHPSFDFNPRGFSRVGDFVELEKVADFGATTTLAEIAAAEAQALRALLPSLEVIAEVLTAAEDQRSDAIPGWPAFNAAMAAALTGRRETAAALFQSILAVPDPQPWSLYPAARALLPLVGDPAPMRAHARREIAARRDAYRLPAISDPFA